MDGELYRLISISNRTNLKEEEVLELLRRSVLILSHSIRKTYTLVENDLVKEYLKVSYSTLKVFHDDLMTGFESIAAGNKVIIRVNEMNVPKWEKVTETKREQIIAIIDSLNEVFDFMNDLVESNLTIKSYAYSIKEVLHRQMSILSVIAVGI